MEQGRVRRLASLALLPMACRAASAKWRSCSSLVERDRSCSCSTVTRARSASRMRLASSSSLCRRMCACKRGRKGVQRGRQQRVQRGGAGGRREREGGRWGGGVQSKRAREGGRTQGEALLRLCPQSSRGHGTRQHICKAPSWRVPLSAISATSPDLQCHLCGHLCVCVYLLVAELLHLGAGLRVERLERRGARLQGGARRV